MPFVDSTINSEILAVHAALIPGGSKGRVLLFGGDEHHSGFQEQASPDGWKKTRIYDVASRSLLTDPVPSPDTDVFCAGHAFLPDGRLLIGGGTSKWGEAAEDHPGGEGLHHGHRLSFGGHRRCWIFNPTDNAWVESAEMLRQPGKTRGGGRWYPMLHTLGSGEVIAFFGHPRFDDDRHRNTIAEKYHATLDAWAGLPQMANPALHPGAGDVRHLMYPRVFQVPDGRLFFASGMPVTAETTYHSTFYDPVSGDYVGDPIAEPAGYGSGWDYPAVLLPLLPEEGYQPRVLFAGNTTARIIDLGAAPLEWQPTVERDDSIKTRRRRNAMAVLLPTGKVCVVNGVHVSGGGDCPSETPEDPVRKAEIYDPGIDWTAGTYTGTPAWDVDDDEAQHARNYHSVALLLPDGTVLTAGGNTNACSGNPDDDVEVGDGTTKKRGIKVIEIYEPDYVAAGGRPSFAGAPSVVSYGQRFIVTSSQAATIERVALVRFGSVTHGHNFDQRYVGLPFDRDGNTLHLTAPPNGNIAPPGFYLLWVVDDEDRPCEQAAIVRLASVACDLVLNRSTFGVFEVEALLSEGSPARVPNAVYAMFDGFRPDELGTPPTPPTVTLRFADNNAAVPASQMRLVHTDTLLEDESASPDVVQRVSFVYAVEFDSGAVFSTFSDQRHVRVELASGPHRCQGHLVLVDQPNPYMIDISASEANPHWLSVDVRVFQIAEGAAFTVVPGQSVTQGTGSSAPNAFLTALLDRLGDHPGAFEDRLSTDQATSKLELARTVGGKRIYNYAVAQVRYRALTVDATDVQVFFRMFTTAATNLRYNPGATYQRDGDWPDSVPLLGKVAGELVSIPFFAEPRVDTTGAGGAPMTAQTDPLNRRTIDAGGTAEVTEYFGAWLDINQLTERFPILPGDSDGPFTGTTPLTKPCTIQELVRGEHQCLVAEIRFQPGASDPIPGGAAPGDSDRLAQRNLAIVESDNPGEVGSRTVAHTFELSPSPTPPLGYPVGAPLGLLGGQHEVALTHAKRVRGPDELLIRWHDVPRGSEVELVVGEIDVDDILRLAATRQGPPVLRKIDDRALGVKVGETTWIPIPGPLEQLIPALLSVRLPEGVKEGDRYAASILQVSGDSRTVLGAWELSIPIGKAAKLRAAEVRKLSVLKHIASTIPPVNRWHPVFLRYLGIVADRVRAYGTDPDLVHGNPDGTGVEWTPEQERPEPDVVEQPDGRPPAGTQGWVRELDYDECGRFRGFLLETCDGRRLRVPTCDRGVERVVRAACADGLLLTVHRSDGAIRRLSVSCC